MATSAVSYRKTNGHSNTDSYQMYIEVYETGNISGTQKQIHIRLWGYAKSPGGYTSYSRPYAYTDYNSRQVRDWWPRNTWIILVEHYVYVEGGQTHTFEGSYNSNDTTSYMPLEGDWYVSVSLYVNPVLPTNVSVAIASSTRTGFGITRTWTNATECNYNIGGQGWQAEGSTLNGIYCNVDTISGLQPNKSYTVQIRCRNGSSDWVNSNTVTGTTTGNNPTISSTSVSGISTSGATINYSASYDTNASYSSLEVQYGLTTSYGTNKTTNVLTGLSPNTTYYYRIRVKDNWNRTSSWSNGSFITHPNKVAVVNPEVTNIGFDSCTLSMSSSDPANTDRSSYSIYASDQTTRIQGHFGDTPAVYSKNITGLEPNTTYYARFDLRTVRSNVWAGVQWVQFVTFAADDFCKLVYSNGTVSDAKKMYAISGKNILDVRGLVGQGGLKGVVGYTFEQNKSISTKRCRCNISTALRLIPGNTYTLTVPNGYRVGLYHYDSNELCLGDSGWLQGTYTFTVPSNNYSYTAYVVSNGTITGEEDLLTVEMAKQLSGFQLELGDIATQYEPFIKEITRNKLHLIE